MKSIFSIKGFLLAIGLIPLVFGLVGYINWLTNVEIKSPVGSVVFILMISFTIIWIILGELRTKMIKIKIENDSIRTRKLGGLFKNKEYQFSEFEGFKISILQSGAGGNEYLYLMKGNQKIIKISDSYHKNYNDLKRLIQMKTNDLGFENFSYLDELKEIFK